MKLSIKDLDNITPVGENITLKYEVGYNGKEEELNIRVYPLTVEEKINLQKKSDELNKLIKIKEPSDEENKEISDLSDSINLDYAYYTMKKISDDITIEYIKKNFPKSWYNDIFKATLRAEGINTDEIEKEKN